MQAIYISSLKALSNDIQKNLQLPLKGINEELFNMGVAHVPITAMVLIGSKDFFVALRNDLTTTILTFHDNSY